MSQKGSHDQQRRQTVEGERKVDIHALQQVQKGVAHGNGREHAVQGRQGRSTANGVEGLGHSIDDNAMIQIDADHTPNPRHDSVQQGVPFNAAAFADGLPNRRKEQEGASGDRVQIPVGRDVDPDEGLEEGAGEGVEAWYLQEVGDAEGWRGHRRQCWWWE